MAKKGSITSIMMANVTAQFAASYFRVGDVPLKNDGTPCADADGNPVFPIVEEILYCKHEFGKGALVMQECYAIKFTGSPEKMIIPASKFAQITIAVTDDADNANVPAMPQ
jgi:hypothetical protein